MQPEDINGRLLEITDKLVHVIERMLDLLEYGEAVDAWDEEEETEQ
jgi:hypothetical protein